VHLFDSLFPPIDSAESLNPCRSGTTKKSLLDVLDRILDKSIVIDAWVRVALVGVDLITVEARVVVASIETYLQHAVALGASLQASRPPPGHTGSKSL